MTPIMAIAGIGNQARTIPVVGQLIRGYQRLAKREMLACAVILILPLVLRAALLPWFPVPQPAAHDEFSYLLAADTYTHGRLTNPTPLFWQHFETFHVLMQPTYQSKYQPLQGLVLAFGQKFLGQPWAGVYLSAALVCASICWMLQGWIASDLALLGALFFALRVGILSYWMNSYFGGAVPGIGGALALGAVARIWRRAQFHHSVTWALGISMVVLSRPYDAAVLAFATAAMVLWFLHKSGTPVRALCMRVALPALIVLLICAAGVAYNNRRVTGDVLTLPYQAHERQYAVASAFAMIPPRTEPEYRHKVLRQYWADWQVDVWNSARAHPILVRLVNLYTVVSFFFPFWILFIPVLLCPYDLKTPQERVTVLLLLAMLIMVAPLILVKPHYVAIFVGLLYLRFLHSLIRLWSWQPWGKPVGRSLGILLVGLLVGDFCNNTFGVLRKGVEVSGFTRGRDSVVQQLENQPGRHLVMLRYAADHNPHDEWVYNTADVDASAIVWAREMGPEQDRPFIDYFRDRRVWLLEPDQSPPKLSPYPRSMASP